MGEYADDHVDQMFDDMAYDYADPFCDLDDYLPTGFRARQFRPHRKTCDRCGLTPLAWVYKTPGEWLLADPHTGEAHVCGGAKLSAFKNLDEAQ